jgi:hypothetical protein
MVGCSGPQDGRERFVRSSSVTATAITIHATRLTKQRAPRTTGIPARQPGPENSVTCGARAGTSPRAEPRAGRTAPLQEQAIRKERQRSPTNFSIATLLPGFLFSLHQTNMSSSSLPKVLVVGKPPLLPLAPRAAAAVHSRTRSQSILLTPLDRLPLLQARLSGPRRRWQTRSTRSPRSSCVPLLLRLFFGRSIIARSSLLFAPCRRG